MNFWEFLGTTAVAGLETGCDTLSGKWGGMRGGRFAKPCPRLLPRGRLPRLGLF